MYVVNQNTRFTAHRPSVHDEHECGEHDIHVQQRIKHNIYVWVYVRTAFNCLAHTGCYSYM